MRPGIVQLQFACICYHGDKEHDYLYASPFFIRDINEPWMRFEVPADDSGTIIHGIFQGVFNRIPIGRINGRGEIAVL